MPIAKTAKVFAGSIVVYAVVAACGAGTAVMPLAGSDDGGADLRRSHRSRR